MQPLYGRTYEHVTTKIFEIDGLPTFLRYAAPVAGLWHAGDPLELDGNMELLFSFLNIISAGTQCMQRMKCMQRRCKVLNIYSPSHSLQAYGTKMDLVQFFH